MHRPVTLLRLFFVSLRFLFLLVLSVLDVLPWPSHFTARHLPVFSPARPQITSVFGETPLSALPPLISPPPPFPLLVYLVPRFCIVLFCHSRGTLPRPLPFLTNAIRARWVLKSSYNTSLHRLPYTETPLFLLH